MARGSHIRRLSEDLSQASINYFLKKGKHLDHFSFDLLVVNPCLLAIVSLIFRGMQSKAFFFPFYALIHSAPSTLSWTGERAVFHSL